jgi:hypothetical protein
MKKKMWVCETCFKRIFKKKNNSTVIHLITDENKSKTKTFKRPIYITDKDPFENLRKEGIKDIDFNEILNNDPKRVFKIWLALGKTIKDWDKGE